MTVIDYHWWPLIGWMYCCPPHYWLLHCGCGWVQLGCFTSAWWSMGSFACARKCGRFEKKKNRRKSISHVRVVCESHRNLTALGGTRLCWRRKRNKKEEYWRALFSRVCVCAFFGKALSIFRLRLSTLGGGGRKIRLIWEWAENHRKGEEQHPPWSHEKNEWAQQQKVCFWVRRAGRHFELEWSWLLVKC